MQFIPQLSHCGIYVRDIDAMTRFYTEVFGMWVTDQGEGRNFKVKLHFLSGTPDQHHQLVLASGRAADTPSTVMQLSFKVTEIDHLRQVRSRALERGATQMRGMNHGNALSIYFSDIEENTVEAYLDTPWYIPQPHGTPLELEKTDAELWAETEAACRASPGFKDVQEWQRGFGGGGTKQLT